MSILSTTLPNGIRIVTDKLAGAESIALGIWVGVGTRHEDLAQNGIAHMLEHMLFKGTQKRTAKDISEVIEDAGGHMNAYTGRETTAYYIHILKDHTDLALDVLSDMLQNSIFPEDELERERAVILQEIHMYEDTPDDVVFERAQMAAYPHQALGASGLGTIDIVKNIKQADLKNYISSRYTADRIVISAAGAVDHEDFVKKVERAFANIPPANTTKTIPGFVTANYNPTPSLVEKDTEQAHLVIGFSGISHHDPRYSAMRILSSVLGGGTSSRLWQEVREKRGLVYSVYSFRDSYEDAGHFGVYAGSSPDNLTELVPIMLDEIVKIQDGITEHELARAKMQIISGARMGREKVMTRVDQQGRHMLIYGSPFDIQELINSVSAVTTADVALLAKDVFKTPMLLSAVGQLKTLMSFDDMRKRLSL
jgi:predicted Zn-dependent peptidase